MVILKKTFIFILFSFLALGMSSCFQDFEPDISSTPVLCMNAEIVADQPVTLFLSRTWRWSEGDQFKLNVDVEDADIRLYVNDTLIERLEPGEVYNPFYQTTVYPEIRKCYKSSYSPKSGDRIRIEAFSTEYGEAAAETTVPFPVAIEKVVTQISDLNITGDISGFPTVAEPAVFTFNCRLSVYFTDLRNTGDYYDIALGHSDYQDLGDAMAWLNGCIPNFDLEPLFTEHVSILESALTDTSGYTIFSDRQINGKTYPLHLGFDDCSFYYSNPLDEPTPKEYGFKVTIRHVDQNYYRHVISLWEANDAIAGALGGIGLGNQVYPFSNVSTGAGVVAAYAVSQITIPAVEILKNAIRNDR